jgi:hypothetical protein
MMLFAEDRCDFIDEALTAGFRRSVSSVADFKPVCNWALEMVFFNVLSSFLNQTQST